MNKLILAFIFILIAGCSTQKITRIEEKKTKEIIIPKNYNIIYCKCEVSDLLNKILGRLSGKGYKITPVNEFENLNSIKTEKNIVLYGYTKKIRGETKKYTTTNLVSRSQSDDCGKGCTIRRSWNELVVNTVSTPGISQHNSVLIYKIDDSTKLLMAINSGDKYSLTLSTAKETGSKANIISESKTYVIK